MIALAFALAMWPLWVALVVAAVVAVVDRHPSGVDS